METRVYDERMWVAIREALSRAESESVAQWIGVADYAARRGADPWQARMRRANRSDDIFAELHGIGRTVAADLGPSPLRTQLLEWLAADVATAAPLLAVFTGHGTDVEHAVVSVPPEDRAALAEWLGALWSEQVSVVDATVIGGGFSRRMWRVSVSSASREGRLIVRVEQGGMFGTDTASEVRAMTALLDSGFAVPAIVAVEPSGEVLGEPFLIMEEVPGVVRLDDEGLDDIIRGVAALHRVPVGVLDDRDRSPEDVISGNIDGWLRLYRAHSPITIPLIEHGAAWLHAHLRPTGRSVVVHGDAGPGNALFHPEHGLTMLDWEFAHVGDAAEDWVYLALIRGRRTMDADAWRARLESVARVTMDEEQWRTWLAFNHFRGACVNLTARTVFESSSAPTADQLAIGVAVHLRFLAQLVEITCA